VCVRAAYETFAAAMGSPAFFIYASLRGPTCAPTCAPSGEALFHQRLVCAMPHDVPDIVRWTCRAYMELLRARIAHLALLDWDTREMGVVRLRAGLPPNPYPTYPYPAYPYPTYPSSAWLARAWCPGRGGGVVVLSPRPVGLGRLPPNPYPAWSLACGA
jgi:hypothetical protein